LPGDWRRRQQVKNSGTTIWRFVYTMLFLCIAWASLLGYSRFVIYNAGRTSWVPETQIRQLMQYHGTDVLRITQDEVYIFRNAKWIPVLKRV